MTRAFWATVGGTLVEEFPLVQRSATAASRRVDGLVLPDGDRRIADWRDVSVKGRDVVVVQTKANRLGMYLLGQALFSAELVKPLEPRSVRSVALCAVDDSVLRPLAERYGIEVVVLRPEELSPM